MTPFDQFTKEMSADVKKALNRIITGKNSILAAEEVHHFSAGDRKLNLMRNKNNSIYLKALHHTGESIKA